MEKQPLLKDGKREIDDFEEFDEDELDHLEYTHLKEVEPREMTPEELQKKLREERAKLLDEEEEEEEQIPVIKPNRRLRKRKEKLKGDATTKSEWVEEEPLKEEEIDYSRAAITGYQEDLDCEVCYKSPCIWECVDCRDIGYCGAKCLQKGWIFHVNNCPVRLKEKEEERLQIIKRQEEERLLAERLGRFPLLWMMVEVVSENARYWWDYFFN